MSTPTFAKSLGQGFMRSACQARNLNLPSQFACVSAIWPFRGEETFAAPSVGHLPVRNSNWPNTIYDTMVETWVIFTGPDAGTYIQTTVHDDFFQTTSTLTTFSTTVTGTTPPGSYDYKSVSATSGPATTSFSSVGTDGTYSIALSNLMDYDAKVALCMTLLSGTAIPAFPATGTTNTASSPFESNGNITIQVYPITGSSSAAIINGGWVGAAANGLPVIAGGRIYGTGTAASIADFNYITDRAGPGAPAKIILCGKSAWRRRSLPPLSGSYFDPNTGTGDPIFGQLGVNIFNPWAWPTYNQLYSHDFSLSPLTSNSVIKSSSNPPLSIFAAADAPTHGELGWRPAVY